MCQLLLSIICVCVSLVGRAEDVPVAAPSPSYIESMSNAVNVSVLAGSNVITKVQPGQILEPGNHVQTKDSSARIVFSDGSAITLGKNSDLEMKTPEQDTKTKKLILISFLKSGFLHARVHHQEDPAAAPHFYIETSTAVAGVRGTEFTMRASADEKDFQLHVLEGKVAVAVERTKISDVPVAGSGEMVGVKGGVISPVEKFNLAEYRKTLSANYAEVHKLIYNQIKSHDESMKSAKPGRRRRRR